MCWEHIPTSRRITTITGRELEPVASLRNQKTCRKAHFVVEKSSYLLYTELSDGRYISLSRIFPEAHAVLRLLPLLQAA